MEKKRARILAPPSKLTQPTCRGTVKQESVKPAKAARPANNAQIFTPDPMPRHLGTIELRQAPVEVKKGYAEPDFVSSSPQARFAVPARLLACCRLTGSYPETAPRKLPGLVTTSRLAECLITPDGRAKCLASAWMDHLMGATDLRTSICPSRMRTSRQGCGCTAGPSSTRPSSRENLEL